MGRDGAISKDKLAGGVLLGPLATVIATGQTGKAISQSTPGLNINGKSFP
jgi:hypothetical protein